ncbi:hypothetical protein SAMN05444405_101371 [Bacteroides luti]|jgi:hypothetical protein|uniref:Uncharacterized protein n=1 Tax=Bacteroides luti TaxID=1297750 RepID=A0A1M4TI16_9BACE|nr:hypothetical protein SAMN05444405_101371 [Bacteroides luti]
MEIFSYLKRYVFLEYIVKKILLATDISIYRYICQENLLIFV